MRLGNWEIGRLASLLISQSLSLSILNHMNDHPVSAPHAQVCFLLAFPVAEVDAAWVQAPQQQLNKAPYFQPVDLDMRLLTATAVQLEGILVSVQPQLFEESVQMVECRFPINDMLSSATLQLVERLKESLRNLLLPTEVLATDLWEEYFLLMIQEPGMTPDLFIDQAASELAGLLRSQREKLSAEDTASSLVSRLHYSERDLTVVDWEGGIIIAPDGDFQSDIEVVKVAIYQLLRYRMLDKRIDERLAYVREKFTTGRRRMINPVQLRRTVQQVIQERLALLLDFERVDQKLLMIGDWYTAQLYRTMSDELYLDEWKNNVKQKLENMESIMRAVQDNFSVSWVTLLDIVQVIGWLLLLLGYIYLFYLDTLAYNIIP